MQHVNDPPYLSFPFRVESTGPALSGRADHIRGQIEQVLFTDPYERVFRPEFGAGVRALVFEPNNLALWEVTRRRLLATLTGVLAGEVDPKTLEVKVDGEPEKGFLRILITYQLAAIGRVRQEEFFYRVGSVRHGEKS